MNRHEALQDEIWGGRPQALSLLPLRLCEVGVDRLDAQGVGVALISSPDVRSLLSASGELAGRVEELQFSLGEGPCLDAFHTGAPACEPDLSRGGRDRWPVFASEALDAGVRAVFAFPLQVGAACFGVLDVARARPGMLDDEQFADAATLAGIATDTVLRLQSEAGHSGVADGLGDIGSERIVVHQATGMISAHAGIDIAAALARLRAHAFSSERPISDVARDVVERTLEFQA